jgi:uncharacterized protein
VRLVVDTNVLVSAFLWQGMPNRLIELAGEKLITLYTSRALVDELSEVLNRKRLSKQVAATGLTAAQMVGNYKRVATLVTPRQLTQQVARDADDDAVLACALAARADVMVSGDKDLLVLKAFRGIPIVTVAQAIQVIAMPGK